MLGHQKIRFLSKWKENCEYPIPTRHERTVSTEIKTISSEIFPQVDEEWRSWYHNWLHQLFPPLLKDLKHSDSVTKNLSFISTLEHYLQTLEVYPTLPQYNTGTGTLNKESRNVDPLAKLSTSSRILWPSTKYMTFLSHR